MTEIEFAETLRKPAEATDRADEATGKQAAHDRQMEAWSKATEHADREALTFDAARIGRWSVGMRLKPGKRWIYPVLNTRTGVSRMLTGNELVRMARQARQDGLTVAMTPAWRDQEGGE